ncbi:uncharacterized protein LOC126794379 [Argentina anserina]|uniref:uncharacterized protein LOC126794379 n=1 Tax=Argentina anserina TaxID=57926 RepID=UPI002176666C|nr:uncharacterized protein LOC126794379 [Potentilla anserina]
MTLLRPLFSKPINSRTPPPLVILSSKPNAFFPFNPRALKFVVSLAAASSRPGISSAPQPSSSPLIPSPTLSSDSGTSSSGVEAIEALLEKVIYGCRFMAFMAVMGSLIGSLLCYIKGCTYVVQSFVEYFAHRSKVILILIDAIDVYLLGTVMIVFGMGLYELFISNLNSVKSLSEDEAPYTSSLFGMFILKARPKWLDITTVNELKTKVGHVIVMLLLIGLLEKSMLAVIQSPLDLLCFSASVLLSSGCLLLLSKLS